MKPIPFILIGVTAMISISILSGLQCKKADIEIVEHQPARVYTELLANPMIWTKDVLRADSCRVSYFWHDPSGKYPFTKDTCCLDSIVWSEAQIGCEIRIDYDTLANQLIIEIQCDSTKQ